MSKIYDLTLSYRLGRRYVNPVFKRFYSKFIVLGKENIPERGPVIFAPNHLNALMDALVILASTPYKLSNTFVARSDIFKKGLFAKVLRFLKILPAFRIRDGYENLGKNDATFDEAREVLEQHNALCVMPEGNQGDQRKLRSFAKGIFRIAFTAQEKTGDKESIKIIPVGIDYSDRRHFGAEVIANYGTPLIVNDYMPLYKENPAIAINTLRADLKSALHKQTVDLATEKYYDAFLTAVYATDRTIAKTQFGKSDAASCFRVRQQTAERLIALETNTPEKAEQLNEICNEYRTLKKHLRLTEETLQQPANAFLFILQSLWLLLTVPVFVCGFVLNMFPFLLPSFIRKKMGVKYDGFFSSFDFVLGGIITFPIFYLLQTILFAILSPTPWWSVLLFIPAQYLLGKWAFKWYTMAGKHINRIRYQILKKNRKQQTRHINELRAQILSIIEAQ